MFFGLFYLKDFNNKVFTINIDKPITNKQSTGFNKASTLYIKRMIIGGHDFFSVNHKMNKPINLADVCFKDSFFTCFERIRIG